MIPMNHFYEGIEGWFDFAEVYREALERCPEHGQMAEVGVCYGRSLFFLAVEIVNSGKKIQVHAVDPFRWPADVWRTFSYYREANDLHEVVVVHRMLSVTAARTFPNNFFDFVFIDAAHDFTNVASDLRAWWPKVKSGGVLAGHDYCEEFPGVEKAVTGYFPSRDVRFIPPKTWWTEKK